LDPREPLKFPSDFAWAKNIEKPAVSTTSELPYMPQMTKLGENQPTYTMNDLP